MVEVQTWDLLKKYNVTTNFPPLSVFSPYLPTIFNILEKIINISFKT
jgi:hypothetical protein